MWRGWKRRGGVDGGNGERGVPTGRVSRVSLSPTKCDLPDQDPVREVGSWRTLSRSFETSVDRRNPIFWRPTSEEILELFRSWILVSTYGQKEKKIISLTTRRYW